MEDTETSETCGVGIRGVAMAIDAVVWFALLFVAVYAVAVATGELVVTETGLDAQLTGAPGTAAFVLWLLLGIGYHTVLEWRFGKTVGKRLVQIRVQGADGTPPSLGASLVRNLLRLVDWLPMLYPVGIVAVVLSDEHRRLGDRLGDTVVVR